MYISRCTCDKVRCVCITDPYKGRCDKLCMHSRYKADMCIAGDFVVTTHDKQTANCKSKKFNGPNKPVYGIEATKSLQYPV